MVGAITELVGSTKPGTLGHPFRQLTTLEREKLKSDLGSAWLSHPPRISAQSGSHFEVFTYFEIAANLSERITR